MLEKKYIIVILLVVAIITLAGLIAYTLMNQTEYQTIQVSAGTTIDVPKTDDSIWTQNEYGIKTYTCPSKHVVLSSFNSQENTNIVGAGGFAIARDMLLTGASDVENYHGYQIKENTINDTHYYIVSTGNNTTHDNIIIGSADLDMLKHSLDTIHYGMPANATAATAPSVVHTNNNNSNSSDDFLNDYFNNAEYYYQMGVSDGQYEGYWYGYSDGYDDSYNNNYYYNDNYNGYYDYGGGSSYDSGSSSDSNMETTTG